MVYHINQNNSGGAIGAGLFIGSGGAFQTGGPASVLIGFLLVGIQVYGPPYRYTHLRRLTQ